MEVREGCPTQDTAYPLSDPGEETEAQAGSKMTLFSGTRKGHSPSPRVPGLQAGWASGPPLSCPWHPVALTQVGGGGYMSSLDTRQ